MFPKEQSLNCLKEQACSHRKKSSFSLKTWLFSRNLNCSPRQLKLLLPWDVIVPWGKVNFLGETYVTNFLTKLIISFFFHIGLQPIIGKDLRKAINLLLKAFQLELKWKKLWSHKVSSTFVPQRIWIRLLPKAIVPWGATMFPQGKNVSKTLCDHNFFIWGITKVLPITKL